MPHLVVPPVIPPRPLAVFTAAPDRQIRFSRSNIRADESAAVMEALHGDHHAGNGTFTARCHERLEAMVPGTRALATHSCTGALEMASLLLDLEPGDEVIMPSWTFASTANAVVLRGAVPVFVDVMPDTLNINVDLAAEAVTDRTRAIFCVHYAGVGCDMEALQALCERHGLALVEDAAQAVGATWRGRALGGIGDIGTFSFHASKNVSCGEGGALLVKSPAHMARAEMLWEKGTDRVRFGRGEVTAYEWQTVGSSFLPSEITAALLDAALRNAPAKTARRVAAWNHYDQQLRAAGVDKHLVLPEIPEEAAHNGHIYHMRTVDQAARDALKADMARVGVEVTTHYQPLHLTPAGLRYGRLSGPDDVTVRASRTLLRLPMDGSISRDAQDHVIRALLTVLPA